MEAFIGALQAAGQGRYAFPLLHISTVQIQAESVDSRSNPMGDCPQFPSPKLAVIEMDNVKKEAEGQEFSGITQAWQAESPMLQ